MCGAPQDLAAVLQCPRSSSRRLALDILGGALQQCTAQGPLAQHCGLLVTVLIHATSDKDASLRSKALGCLEQSAGLLIMAQQDGPSSVAGGSPAAAGEKQRAELVAECIATR